MERLGVIECAVFFSIRAEILSAPVDFFTSSVVRSGRSVSSEQRKSSGKLDRVLVSNRPLFPGRLPEWLSKFLKNCSLRMFALAVAARPLLATCSVSVLYSLQNSGASRCLMVPNRN